MQLLVERWEKFWSIYQNIFHFSNDACIEKRSSKEIQIQVSFTVLLTCCFSQDQYLRYIDIKEFKKKKKKSTPFFKKKKKINLKIFWSKQNVKSQSQRIIIIRAKAMIICNIFKFYTVQMTTKHTKYRWKIEKYDQLWNKLTYIQELINKRRGERENLNKMVWTVIAIRECLIEVNESAWQ